LFYQKGKGLI